MFSDKVFAPYDLVEPLKIIGSVMAKLEIKDDETMYRWLNFT